MDAILADLLPNAHLPYPVMIARFCGAIISGALIGYERQARNKAAGLRTHILVSLAACVFAVISVESIHLEDFGREQVRIDPMRVVEAVTSGVAFLAAGTIVMARGRVHGVTTGASMWLAAAIGLAIGFGYWPVALFSMAACLLTLTAIYQLERRHRMKRHVPDEEAEAPDHGRPQAADLADGVKALKQLPPSTAQPS
ncbi:hypothetical protein BJF93_09890 [Xaviernesmea oryzae]|uniref:Protein MgtC n=1 Tax=Xaviernesmea oryzae TaxID=464029 RepID=A0A1Q9AWU3_9HYPH|nr:MgtC/SapB family protein [Xaviernesmea oryzae]OLP59904.1 hypothetical protein BJF93_09890 [Xaviernesmea oryzae]SEK45955.1 putative Mg2+ transporter-C (MgtC) family protein [Xaviernesmea oryzae]